MSGQVSTKTCFVSTLTISDSFSLNSGVSFRLSSSRTTDSWSRCLSSFFIWRRRSSSLSSNFSSSKLMSALRVTAKTQLSFTVYEQKSSGRRCRRMFSDLTKRFLSSSDTNGGMPDGTGTMPIDLCPFLFSSIAAA